ncbi:hypothetical protein NPIL_67811 [Nephila pilipes]|uniref:Uncharacterized protein n=1 Tax=Nephila pilipes TaxID=299642 RepID=A0A8X6NWC9_NEPPI|nr:hypothetical protein NPIL_67811 [Nephila pilipes]
MRQIFSDSYIFQEKVLNDFIERVEIQGNPNSSDKFAKEGLRKPWRELEQKRKKEYPIRKKFMKKLRKNINDSNEIQNQQDKVHRKEDKCHSKCTVSIAMPGNVCDFPPELRTHIIGQL